MSTNTPTPATNPQSPEIVSKAKQTTRSRRPANTPFRQQRLKAWQPILTPKCVIPTFLAVGVIFLIIGPLLLTESAKVIESDILRYDTKCPIGISCVMEINVPAKMTAPIYMYYQLENFYQNHRRYVQSRSNTQLRGEIVTSYAQLGDCEPLIAPAGASTTDPKQWYFPCGLIAASMFNDTFTQLKDASSNLIAMSKEGIAWASDLETKFKNVPADKLADRGIPPVGMSNFPNMTDPDFVVWMRTAALPTFRKLYRIINTNLEKGKYSITIGSNFPVAAFSGQKKIVLSTASVIGGKNDFLGYAYLVVGIICVILAIGFLLKHKVSPRKLGDTKFLLWTK